MTDFSAPVLADALGLNPDRARLRGVSGGSIGRAHCLEDDRERLFLKRMPVEQRAILDAERDGLVRLAKTGVIATPRVIGQGQAGRQAWLALEWLEMRAPDANCFVRMGENLSQLHRQRTEMHGLDRDNFIGSGAQINTPCASWTEFLFESRLGPQIRRLAGADASIDANWLDRLEQRWRERFEDYCPVPSLLHGDLWSGNVAMLPDGRPLLFDPAVHYGDRECDLAMAELFGGFDAGFFDAYRGHWPLEPGWRERREYYGLYHLLNHANLFGGHYVAACRARIGDLLGGGRALRRR